MHGTEIFGPVLSLHEVDSVEAALEMVNSGTYGNAASIATSSGEPPAGSAVRPKSATSEATLERRRRWRFSRSAARGRASSETCMDRAATLSGFSLKKRIWWNAWNNDYFDDRYRHNGK